MKNTLRSVMRIPHALLWVFRNRTAEP